MTIRVEKKYVPSETIEIVVVTLKKVDYEAYTWSKFVEWMVKRIFWTICISGVFIFVGMPIGLGYYAASTLGWSDEAITWTWLLYSFIAMLGSIPIIGWIENSEVSKRYSLLERNGLKYDSWERRWPRHRVELEKSMS